MIANHYRSAVVVPLQARGRTLGAISILRLEPSKPFGQAERPYGQEDLELACELARRAALAIDNARLFSDLRRLEQRLEAILTSVAEAITVIDRGGRTIFANQAAADLLGFPTPSELTGAPAGHDHVALPASWTSRETSSTWSRCPAGGCSAGEHPEPLLVRNIVRATRRGALADRARASPIADPETGRDRLRGQRLRERHRGQARAAGGELHGRGQPRARLLDGLHRDAARGRAPGRAADRRLVRGRRAGRERGDRTRGRPSLRPAQARAGGKARPQLPPSAGRSRGGAGGDPQRAGAHLHGHRPGRARRLRARQRAPGAAARGPGDRRDHRAAGRADTDARRDHARLLGVEPALVARPIWGSR